MDIVETGAQNAPEKTLNLKSLDKRTRDEIKRLEGLIEDLKAYIAKTEKEVEKIKRILH